MKIKMIIILVSLSFLFSCVSSNKKSNLKTKNSNSISKNSDNSQDDNNSNQKNISTNNAIILDGQVSTVLSLKTFNQYNQTLSKVTGIDSATSELLNEYNTIKNSLPSDQSASRFTAFHQIAETRLAFTYCNYFIKNNSEFKSLDYAKITATEATDKLMLKFIGKKELIEKNFYDSFYKIVFKILNNDGGLDDVGSSVGPLINIATIDLKMKNLTILGCTAILASSEFTTI